MDLLLKFNVDFIYIMQLHNVQGTGIHECVVNINNAFWNWQQWCPVNNKLKNVNINT